MCCFSQLSLLSDRLGDLIRLDPFSVLPKEISLKVLGYLDAFSLGRAAQVSRSWRVLADDDVLWHNICEQHIGQKCRKCGWGLPLMVEKKKRLTRPGLTSSASTASVSSASSQAEVEPEQTERPPKRRKVSPGPPSLEPAPMMTAYFDAPTQMTRPWKSVYCERLTIERNWRSGRCSVTTLKGHTDGVMCMQFNENLIHPSYPVLITGSYDRTARVWNLETGEEVCVLRGHTRAVRALQFDEAKLITGSMDRSLRVWNWRTGACIRVLEGHTEGVVCLKFDSNILASGSVDTTVKIWNFRNGECFTLRGHRDWVNAIELWDDPSFAFSERPTPSTSANALPDIDPGKLLFSASDDGTIKLWDLARRTCVRTFTGHVGQVQSIKLLMVGADCAADDSDDSHSDREDGDSDHATRVDNNLASPGHVLGFVPASSSQPAIIAPHGINNQNHATEGLALHFDATPQSPPLEGSWLHAKSPSARLGRSKGKSPAPANTNRQRPVLISGSLDNTLKTWDVETGETISTMFGHVEGVWAVASDNLRLVSGSHDRTIKVWVREEARCMATLVGHRGAVTCLSLGDDKIVSGSDDGDIRVWNFSR